MLEQPFELLGTWEELFEGLPGLHPKSEALNECLEGSKLNASCHQQMEQTDSCVLFSRHVARQEQEAEELPTDHEAHPLLAAFGFNRERRSRRRMLTRRKRRLEVRSKLRTGSLLSSRLPLSNKGVGSPETAGVCLPLGLAELLQKPKRQDAEPLAKAPKKKGAWGLPAHLKPPVATKTTSSTADPQTLWSFGPQALAANGWKRLESRSQPGRPASRACFQP